MNPELQKQTNWISISGSIQNHRQCEWPFLMVSHILHPLYCCIWLSNLPSQRGFWQFAQEKLVKFFNCKIFVYANFKKVLRPNKRRENKANVAVLRLLTLDIFPNGLSHLSCIFKIWRKNAKVVEHLNIIKAERPHKH